MPGQKQPPKDVLYCIPFRRQVQLRHRGIAPSGGSAALRHAILGECLRRAEALDQCAILIGKIEYVGGSAASYGRLGTARLGGCVQPLSHRAADVVSSRVLSCCGGS